MVQVDEQNKHRYCSCQSCIQSTVCGLFVDGITKPDIIKEAKNWLRNNVFTPAEILKQMDT